MTEEHIVQTNNSNASASAFGWDFQRNAALFLMLKNIKSANTVRVEGGTEDIEISLDNGNTIYSQAKSIDNINSTSNVLTKLKDALRTLNSASQRDNVEKLIYITNIPNPLNDVNSRNLFWGSSNISFSELPDTSQNKINKIIHDKNYTIDTNTLNIIVIPFFGADEDNRYKYIKEEVANFLATCDIRDISAPQQIMEIWQKDFFVNSTISDLSFKIKKQEMVWTIIAYLCSFDRYPTDEVLDGCDDAMIFEIERNYGAIINNKAEDFQFFNKVLNDYKKYGPTLSKKEKTSKYINEQWKQYENHFGIDNLDPEVKECLIKLILKKIIDIRYITDTIKKGAGL